MDKKTTILGKAREEGYKDGLGQASQCAYDDAYENGRQRGLEESNHISWFIGGLILGSLISYITGVFVL